jgi:hypothetical protein
VVSNAVIQLSNCQLFYQNLKEDVRVNQAQVALTQDLKPSFKFIPHDTYANVLESFPVTEIALFSLEIVGDIYTETDPIIFS